jgi:hypothetical protein
MINNEIETKLRNWFEKMVNRYKWLNIKFEYSETRGIYLVSYSPVQKIEESDSFIKETMDFEDTMNSLYGDDSPLFCDEEKYFKLSSNAEIIKSRFKFFDISIAKEKLTRASNFSSPLYKNQDCNYYSNNYALAA